MGILFKVKGLLLRLLQEYKYYRMDQKYYSSAMFHCWDMYPPSFYVRYSKEEQERIKNEDITELYAMLEQYCKENGIESPVKDYTKKPKQST